MERQIELSPATMTDMPLPEEKFTKQRCEFTIRGVDNSITNALRRTLMMEIKGTALHCEYESVQTTDTRIIINFLVDRIGLIPVLQTCPLDAVFTLDVTNQTEKIMGVMAHHFKIKRKGSEKGIPLTVTPFENLIYICDLDPGCSLRIDNVTLVRNYGYVHAKHCVVHSGVIAEEEDTAINPYENPNGPRISNRVIYNWAGAFETNGTVEPKAIALKACRTVIKRLNNVKTYLNMIETVDGISRLNVINETYTFKELILRGVLAVRPKIAAITVNVNETTRVCLVSLRDVKDPAELLAEAIDNRVKILETVMSKMEEW